jgi:hypothetical protein
MAISKYRQQEVKNCDKVNVYKNVSQG